MARLNPPVTETLPDPTDDPVGAVSYSAEAPRGGAVLWLYCRDPDDQTTAEVLIAHAVLRMRGHAVSAFFPPSPLTPGLLGLPIRTRPAVRRALQTVHLEPVAEWRYRHTLLPIAGLPHAGNIAVTGTDAPAVGGSALGGP